MKCPNCGAVYDEPCRFCGICGSSLTAEKKGRHRVPILIMAVLTVLGTCLFFATGGTLAPEPSDIPQLNDFYGQPFYIVDGALSANYEILLEETEITVPETVNGQTVTSIDIYAFSSFSATGVYLPDTVTQIGESAFEYCTFLRGMDLPPALTVIEDYAFFNCVSLEAIHIPVTVEYIGDDTFYGCDSLTFIFYDGTIDQWKALFSGELLEQTAVCCSDGTFFQAE